MVEVVDCPIERRVALKIQSALLVLVYSVVSFIPHGVHELLNEEEELCHPPEGAAPCVARVRIVIPLLLVEPFLDPYSVCGSPEP